MKLKISKLKKAENDKLNIRRGSNKVSRKPAYENAMTPEIDKKIKNLMVFLCTTDKNQIIKKKYYENEQTFR